MSDPLVGEARAAGGPAGGAHGASGLAEGFQGNDGNGSEAAEEVAPGEAAERPARAGGGAGDIGKPRRRRRGSRGGRGRQPTVPLGTEDSLEQGATEETVMPAVIGPVSDGPPGGGPAGSAQLGAADASAADSSGATASGAGDSPDKVARPQPGPALSPPPVGPTAALPEFPAGEVRKPKIGDTRPGSPPVPRRRPRREPVGTGVRPLSTAGQVGGVLEADEVGEGASGLRQGRGRRRRGGSSEAAGGEQAALGRPGSAAQGPSAQLSPDLPDRLAKGRPESGRRRGERRPRPLGRYLMVVHVGPTATQIAVLEGRTLIEHYVSRPADDTTQIDGNIYLGRVQNVLPGMEAAFVDIGTPKNAVLYRGDLRYDEDDVALAGEEDTRLASGRPSGPAREARIEQLLHTGQSIICQVTKNPIGTKGARLTQEVSLPGRFVVLIPESETYGISKRLPDEERRRLRRILDEVRPEGHGLIVRTAAEGVSADELARDVSRLLGLWEKVQSAAKTSRPPQLLYREPDLAVRVIREEFNRDYRGVVIDDPKLFAEVKEYVTDISPELAERVELVDPAEEPLPLFERFRVHEQVHKALDRKVWLPSGGSIIIERTEALTVIDVNTGKNVGTSNLEETVFRNNLEAAEEIARQLRLRDIGGIIVIDFIDMEVPANRAEVMRVFREALARDKTRTQVFDISELGLVEMTRKRVSEGLVESYSETCPTCGGRGIVFDESLLG